MGIDRGTISRTPEATLACSESGRAVQLTVNLALPACPCRPLRRRWWSAMPAPSTS